MKKKKEVKQKKLPKLSLIQKAEISSLASAIEVKLNSFKFGIAGGIVGGIFAVIVALVALSSGYPFNYPGIFVGASLGFVLSWLFAEVYNKLLRKPFKHRL